ncbi:carboxy-terminal kinesin 2-like isoform X2 [Halichondria panicea]|uniref:carboxy-terminal kinesin 2-like isoform X2 n=1 Tax=Halichondria panicea TaxID=6063 RepID=UPI00312B9838
MEKRVPLSAKNTGIPKPSRLPQPATVGRKRPLSQVEQSSNGKENGPAVKRAKTFSSTTKPVTKPAKVITKPPVKTTTFKSTAVRSSTRATKAPLKAPVTKCTVSNTKTSSAATSGKAPKRPAWDLKGQLQDMAADHKSSVSTIDTLRNQLDSFAGRLGELERLKETQETTIQAKEEEKTVAHSQIKELEETISATKRDLESMERSKAAIECRASELDASLSLSRTEVASLRTALSQTMANMSAVQSELEATKVARDCAVSDGVRKAATISSLEQNVIELQCLVGDYQGRIREDEMTRRALHNRIQELKGNIRVFCRVRPLLPTDAGYLIDDAGRESSTSGGSSRGSKNGGQSSTSVLGLTYPDSNNDQKKLSIELSSQDKAKKNYEFTFDRVFGPNSSQQFVFSEISQLVQSALDGYNVCIFAYGQTGSGKTFTMEGPEERVLLESEGDMKGMIPRAVDQVFSSALQLREQGWEYKMEAMFLEIYNESLRDLLSSTTQTIDIKKDPQHAGEVYVTNVTPSVVTSQKQVQKLLERASKNRAVASTQCNERSSRSHSVFILTITGRNEATKESCRGILNLVDLAGSERLSQSGSAGDRLKETKSINKSLSNLGSVIMALANKESHIPYRNSKLTYLLQNSLGGNSKTLMFVNVSPQAESYQETLCSLRFATTVNQCNIGTAKKSSK